ncbi:MAG: hypothetical protein VX112_04815 [Pseudomonadota bacterium]|nr:hypothetical protein [Pseudomonadota bacterium]
METGYTNQAERLLNYKSTLYAKYQFGLFSIVHPQLSTQFGEPRRCCLFTAKSILNNTPPIQIPLLDIEPIADLKDADMQYLIASIEKQDPAFLWYLLRSFLPLLSNACLDEILTHSEKLRSYLNTRMMPESYHRYLLSFTSLNNNYISSDSILSRSIKELLVSMIEYTPITCLRADRPDILQTLLKHGADPYVSLRFDESQYKAFLPEHFGLPAGKNIYRLRRAMLDESSKISANNVETTNTCDRKKTQEVPSLKYQESYYFNMENHTSEIVLPLGRFTLKNDARLNMKYCADGIEFISENHTPQSPLSLFLENTDLDNATVNSSSTETTLASLLESTHTHSLLVIDKDKVVFHLHDNLAIDTEKITWSENPNVMSKKSTLQISFAISDILSLHIPSLIIQDPLDIRLFFNYGRQVFTLHDYNLIQYTASIGFSQSLKILANQGADLFFDSRIRPFNTSLQYLASILDNGNQSTYMACCNQSLGFHDRFTQYISDLISMSYYKTVRTLLIQCRSDLDLDYLFNTHRALDLMRVALSSCGDYLNSRMKVNSKQTTKSIQRHRMDMDVFIEILNRRPELVYKLFSLSDDIDHFDTDLADIACKALSTRTSGGIKSTNSISIVIFLLGPYANTDIILRLARQNSFFFENLDSMAKVIPEIKNLVQTHDPTFFESQKKSCDQLPKPVYQPPTDFIIESDRVTLSERITDLIVNFSTLNASIGSLTSAFSSTQKAHLLHKELDKLRQKIHNRLNRFHHHLKILAAPVSHDDYQSICVLVEQDPRLLSELNTEVLEIGDKLKLLQQEDQLKTSNEKFPNNSLSKNSLMQPLIRVPNTEKEHLSKLSAKDQSFPHCQIELKLYSKSSLLSNVFYKSCISLFFSSEYPYLPKKPPMIHYAPLRFLIFLMEVDDFQKKHDELLCLSSYYTRTTRNIFTHHGFFLPEDISKKLIGMLDSLKNKTGSKKISFDELQQSVNDWVFSAYSLCLAHVDDKIDPTKTLDDQFKQRLLQLYTQDFGKRNNRVRQLLTFLIESHVEIATENSDVLRLSAVELGEHLKANSDILHSYSEQPLDSLRQCLISRRHFFHHKFFLPDCATLETLFQQIFSPSFSLESNPIANITDLNRTTYRAISLPDNIRQELAFLCTQLTKSSSISIKKGC